MDEQILRSLENFEELWRRVSAPMLPAASPPATSRPTSKDPLFELLRLTQSAAQRYEQLAGHSVGAAARTLTRHAQQTRVQLRQMQAEYFLLHGRRLNLPHSKPATLSRPEALRDACLSAWKRAELCENAASETPEGGLRTQYFRWAANERRRAEEDRQLLLQCF